MVRGKVERSEVFGRGSGKPPEEAFDGFYLFEVRVQCDFALRAFGEIRERVSQGPRGLTIFAFAHMFLVFAGNVSKLLFATYGAPEAAQRRAARLRGLVGITEDPVPRDARNFVEHFDERLDRFLRRTPTDAGVLVHRAVGDRAPKEIELDDGRVLPAFFMQFFATDTLELRLYSWSLRLEPVAKSLQEIQRRCSTALAALSDVEPEEE